MRTSDKGKAFNRRFEGLVLRAYRCPAGKWTIGDGLTAASGVVDPGPGMVITQDEADRLLDEALRRNYEPAVTRAMPGARQHEFDGGVSFHWNTGAISRASWVPAWASGNRAAMRERLKRWTKGGGKVLPGLVRRREAEANLIQFADYGTAIAATPSGLARMALDLSPAELAAAREGFAALGYAPGDDARGIATSAVRAFQEANDLTVDGILGRATLSTLQRRLDARAGAALGATVSTTGGVASAANPVSEGVVAWADTAVLAGGLLLLIWLGWQYRDVVATKLAPHLPRVAAKLRSIK